MKKIIPILLTCILLMFSQSCSMMKMYNMSKCDFSFYRLTGVSWAGIDFMNKGFNYSTLDLATVLKCTKAIVNRDFTINFSLDIKASNPGKKEAGIAGFDYTLYYGDEMVGDGVSMNKNDITVRPKGGSTIIPVSFHLDLKDFVDIKQPIQSGEKVVNIIRDISKVGSEDTPFSIRIRPYIRTGSQIVKGPYFTIQDK